MEDRRKDLITAAILLVLAIILTLIIHLTKINGVILSPMHLPILLAGFILGPIYGLIIGILAPIINGLLKIIPTFPITWAIVVESGLYGLISGLFYEKFGMKVMPALVGSIVLGKIGGGAVLHFLDKSIKTTTFIAFPGIIVQLILVPTIFKIYKEKTKTIINLE